MQKNVSRGSEEFQMFTDYFALYKKYGEVENNDQYWEELLTELNAFCEKYKNVKKEFSREIALALSNELEREYKQIFKR